MHNHRRLENVALEKPKILFRVWEIFTQKKIQHGLFFYFHHSSSIHERITRQYLNMDHDVHLKSKGYSPYVYLKSHVSAHIKL